MDDVHLPQTTQSATPTCPTQPVTTPVTDQTVVDAKRDRDAIARLFDAYYPPILAYCVHRLASREVGEDVAAEVFLKMAEHLPSLRGDSLPQFERWLYQIATHAIRARMRTRSRRRALLKGAAEDGVFDRNFSGNPGDVGDSPADSGGKNSQILYAALFTLSQRDQALIVARHMEGWGFDQIAQRFNLRPDAARVALSRALQRLKKRIEQTNQETGQRL
jgi:RNA polymerase sigma-70 factor (ECF subfamily)